MIKLEAKRNFIPQLIRVYFILGVHRLSEKRARKLNPSADGLSAEILNGYAAADFARQLFEIAVFLYIRLRIYNHRAVFGRCSALRYSDIGNKLFGFNREFLIIKRVNRFCSERRVKIRVFEYNAVFALNTFKLRRCPVLIICCYLRLVKALVRHADFKFRIGNRGVNLCGIAVLLG